MTPREAAQASYDAAKSVTAIFAGQVVRRREAWRRAAPADSVKARNALARAVKQEAAAKITEQAAYRKLHSIQHRTPHA